MTDTRDADEHQPDRPEAGAPVSAVRKRLRRGRRLAPETRRETLLEVAAELVLGQGFLPIGVQDLADAAKVSKALVYRYFPGPQDLYNALVERGFDELTAAGLEAAARRADLADAATAAAELYFRSVVQTGPVIHIILRDRFMAGRLSPRAAAVQGRVARRFARGLRSEFKLPLRECVACVSLGMTLPEECGRLVYQGELDEERGAEACRELVLGVIDVARRRGAEARREPPVAGLDDVGGKRFGDRQV
ncbi:TetR/AcrR family transcriptional regulator [Phenylobacterium sp.]|uniref:TetR/AcrR family transcriptional regulator n=1 Tax=Phenylobacterium sp. TaxID=1871053 RepID=UPI002FE41DFE